MDSKVSKSYITKRVANYSNIDKFAKITIAIAKRIQR